MAQDCLESMFGCFVMQMRKVICESKFELCTVTCIPFTELCLRESQNLKLKYIQTRGLVTEFPHTYL